MNHFYLFISSNADTHSQFPENTRSEFKIPLQTPLDCQKGQWEAAISDISIPASVFNVSNDFDRRIMVGLNRKKKAAEGLYGEIIFPSGNYTPESFCSVFNECMQKIPIWKTEPLIGFPWEENSPKRPPRLRFTREVSPVKTSADLAEEATYISPREDEETSSPDADKTKTLKILKDKVTDLIVDKEKMIDSPNHNEDEMISLNNNGDKTSGSFSTASLSSSDENEDDNDNIEDDKLTIIEDSETELVVDKKELITDAIDQIEEEDEEESTSDTFLEEVGDPLQPHDTKDKRAIFIKEKEQNAGDADIFEKGTPSRPSLNPSTHETALRISSKKDHQTDRNVDIPGYVGSPTLPSEDGEKTAAHVSPLPTSTTEIIEQESQSDSNNNSSLEITEDSISDLIVDDKGSLINNNNNDNHQTLPRTKKRSLPSTPPTSAEIIEKRAKLDKSKETLTVTNDKISELIINKSDLIEKDAVHAVEAPQFFRMMNQKDQHEDIVPILANVLQGRQRKDLVKTDTVNNVPSIINHLVKEKEKGPAFKGSMGITATYDKSTRKISFDFKGKEEGIWLNIPNQNLRFMLGFGQDQKGKLKKIKKKGNRITLDNICQMNAYIEDMYIYSDFVCWSAVGSVCSPIMGYFNISSAVNKATEEMSGSMQFHVSAEKFFPVVQKVITAVGFKCCDGSGANMGFSNGKVVINVHFRKTSKR